MVSSNLLQLDQYKSVVFYGPEGTRKKQLIKKLARHIAVSRVKKAFSSILARSLNWRGNKCANINKNSVLANISKLTVIELHHDKTCIVTCAQQRLRDQPGHPPVLIRVMTVYIEMFVFHSY